MTPEEPFIRAIREAPNDDASRLIYADWLEEHRQAARAEFIRLQCQIARVPDTGPERLVLVARAENLLRAHWKEWVGPLHAIVGPWHDRYGELWLGEEYHPDGLRSFHRGFVDSLALDADAFLRNVESVKCLVPLRELRLWGAGRCAERLASEPELAGLSVLSFTDYYDAPLTAPDVAFLAKSPYLHGVSALYLGRNSLGDDGVEALLHAPWLVHVSILDLSDNGLSDRALRALAESANVVNLRKLFLQNNYFSSAGIDALRSSSHLRFLTHLEHDPVIQLGPILRRHVFTLGESERP